jgi:CTP synthase (UTP-ammonia lyase)
VRDPVKIGIIGDFNPDSRYHRATNASIQHAAAALSLPVEITWLPTPSLEGAHLTEEMVGYDGLWCSPGSPYDSMQGALDGIRFARESGMPFVGT